MLSQLVIYFDVVWLKDHQILLKHIIEQYRLNSFLVLTHKTKSNKKNPLEVSLHLKNMHKSINA